MQAFTARKLGMGQMPRVTTAQAEMQSQMIHMMLSLPQGTRLQIQDAGGHFAYLPGYDGPADP